MIESQEQKRILNLSSATCTVICTMIGAGIFMTTGLYASELDSGIGLILIFDETSFKVIFFVSCFKLKTDGSKAKTLPGMLKA